MHSLSMYFGNSKSHVLLSGVGFVSYISWLFFVGLPMLNKNAKIALLASDKIARGHWSARLSRRRAISEATAKPLS